MTVYRNSEKVERRTKNEAMTDIEGKHEHEMAGHQNFLNDRFTWIKFHILPNNDCSSININNSNQQYFEFELLVFENRIFVSNWKTLETNNERGCNRILIDHFNFMKRLRIDNNEIPIFKNKTALDNWFYSVKHELIHWMPLWMDHLLSLN